MEILESVDTVLSAPALPDPILSRCKIFLLKPISKSSLSASTGKPIERVVGCVVVQPIRTALKVLGDDELREMEQDSDDGQDRGRKRRRDDLVVIGENMQSEDGAKAGAATDVSTKAVVCL
jgi:hypothetical protein